MLLALITVVILIATGFFALSVGATGRLSSTEGSTLSVASRAIALGVALIAFAAAYVVYSRQQAETGSSALASITTSANRSSPREADAPGRNDAAADTSADETTETLAVADLTARPRARADNSRPVAEVVAEDALGDDDAANLEPVMETAAAVDEMTPAVTDSDGLSATALALEARQSTRRAPTPAYVAADTAPSVTRSVAAAPLLASAASLPAAPRQSTTPTRRAKTGSPRRGPLNLHIHNRLGRGQSSEQLLLTIEGLPVADFGVDELRPAVSVAVPLPRPGLLHYRLEGISDDGGLTQLQGAGCIKVVEGAHYSVRRQPGSNRVFLQSTRAVR